MKMNRFKYIVCAILGTGLLNSCKNTEIEHPDYEYTSGFFPYQYPVRTLVLGDYIYDNSNDNDGKFLISVAMGGVYENKQDRVFEIRVDESLARNIVVASTRDTIRPMPQEYYTLSSPTSITIPKGEYNGGVEVQLTDAFFSDPEAIRLTYVIPVLLVRSSDVDSILSGSTTMPSPDLRRASDWSVTPKNFTLFGVRYMNEFDANYFHYGASTVKDSTGTQVESKTYQNEYVEFNPVERMTTTGRRQVQLNTHLNSDEFSGEIKLLLDFDGDNCTVTSASPEYRISGTGVFKKEAFTWGNKPRNGIELNFTVTDGTYTYEAKDVFVVRDRPVVMEVFNPDVVSGNN